jgi:hypothetical protein
MSSGGKNAELLQGTVGRLSRLVDDLVREN